MRKLRRSPPRTRRCPPGVRKASRMPSVDPLAHRGRVDLQKPADVVGGVELVHSALSPGVPARSPPRQELASASSGASETVARKLSAASGHGGERQVRFDRALGGWRPAAPGARRPSPASASTARRTAQLRILVHFGEERVDAGGRRGPGQERHELPLARRSRRRRRDGSCTECVASKQTASPASRIMQRSRACPPPGCCSRTTRRAR